MVVCKTFQNVGKCVKEIVEEYRRLANTSWVEATKHFNAYTLCMSPRQNRKDHLRFEFVNAKYGRSIHVCMLPCTPITDTTSSSLEVGVNMLVSFKLETMSRCHCWTCVPFKVSVFWDYVDTP